MIFNSDVSWIRVMMAQDFATSARCFVPLLKLIRPSCALLVTWNSEVSNDAGRIFNCQLHMGFFAEPGAVEKRLSLFEYSVPYRKGPLCLPFSTDGQS